MVRDIPRFPLEGPLDLTLPDGSSARVRPGPYGKGIAVVHVRPHAADTPLDGEGRPGRKPSPSTIELRKRLRQDKADGGLRTNTEYVQWLQGIDDNVSLAVARQTVYRERKRLP